ncbi:MAG TPA: hypothetical protein ENN19_00285 [Chloroflexi bacterium]|nr:hypothetical protein [Chloroflexota bacterium]
MKTKTGYAHHLLTYLLLTLLTLVLTFAIEPPPTHAQPVIPPVWDIVYDDFEGDSLDSWYQSGTFELVDGGGYGGTTGLEVSVDSAASVLYQTDVARATEGYVTFWFNPNGVSIPDAGTSWAPGKSICIATVVHSGDWWPPLVALYVRRPTGEGYQAYLAWPDDANDANSRHFDYDSPYEFDLVDGWQKLTIGYRIDEWVAVWRDGELMRHATDVVHADPYGDIVQLGKTNPTQNDPSGALRFDEYAFQVPRVDDLWVDAENGDDGNDGLTAGAAFRTIQAAAHVAGPGTSVHVMPGVYRETVRPALNGSPTESQLYVAENGPGTAVLRGSEPSSAMTWTQMTANTIGLPPGVDPTKIYSADLSAWNLEKAPRFVAQLDDAGETITRLPLAREPDWTVSTEWKHAEFWWAADGGSDVAGCDPSTDDDPRCDQPWRSTLQLTDRTDDAEPAGIEAGNLSTLGDLTGATLVAIDTVQGHYVYRRRIVAHNVGAGRVTVDQVCEHDGGSGNPGLGWGSKYYVENHPALLDTPGEWWYDAQSGRLYIWPLEAGDPATMNVEISRRDRGFNLQNRSYVTLDSIDVELVNENGIHLVNHSTHRAYGNTVRRTTIRYVNRGVDLEQSVRASAPAANVIDGFTLENSEISHADSLAIRLIDWWENSADPDAFTRSGIRNTVIRNNELHHMGFRTDSQNAVGMSFMFANQLRFEGNHVHHVAHNGVQFSKSVIQSPKTYDFSPDEIKTGEILIKDNVFEKACQLTTDCGAVKFWGAEPDNHVFRDVLVTGNVFRDTFGWSYVSEKRGSEEQGWWYGGAESDVQGMGGFGLYLDHVSGLHVYRNVAYNNAYANFFFHATWRDGPIIYYNNVAANALYGFSLGGASYDTHPSVDTQVVNNVLINNEGYGIRHFDRDGVYGNMSIDHNLYHNNGWRTRDEGGMWHTGAMAAYVVDGPDGHYKTLADIQAHTDWEAHGVEGDPAFRDYDVADHDLHDGSWPDFRLTSASPARNQGTERLPDSLTALLDFFDVDDVRVGPAFDIGRYESGFELVTTPPARAIPPGGAAHYQISVDPPDAPYTVALTVTMPSPYLNAALSAPAIVPGEALTLTLNDTHTGTSLLPGLVYTIPITGTGNGYGQHANVRLLVGGARVYLPLIVRGD